MSDLGLVLIFASVTLFFAWFANALVGLLSGEHPRDTGRVWLDIAAGDFRGLIDVLMSKCSPACRWTIGLAIAMIVVLIFLKLVG